MDLQSYLTNKFTSWQPPPPTVEGRTKCDVTLCWNTEPFDFLEGDLLFWVQKKEKMPPWVIVYSGGKTTKTIDNLPPRHPHRFRVKVILKATDVSTLAQKALQRFGNDKAVYDYIENYKEINANKENLDTGNSEVTEEVGLSDNDNKINVYTRTDDNTEFAKEEKGLECDNDENAKTEILDIVNGGDGDNKTVVEERLSESKNKEKAAGDTAVQETVIDPQIKTSTKWLESQWSEDTSTSTDTDGTSAVCFCMAVRCGYIKQLQVMLEEKPALLEIINSNNGFTPLATAVRKGDLTTVKFLIAAGADVNQPSSSGQTPLHLAALGARPALVDLLLDNGADFQAHDLNGLRVEHYAVDAGSQEMVTHILQRGGDIHVRDSNGWTPLFRARDLNGLRVEHYAVDAGSQEMVTHILQRGGDIHVRDSNGWTPLFRAVTQGATSELIELLVLAGSDVDANDYAGLALPSAARLLHNRQGRERDSILRLVDSQYPREVAVANFTRLTKKISSLHTLFK